MSCFMRVVLLALLQPCVAEYDEYAENILHTLDSDRSQFSVDLLQVRADKPKAQQQETDASTDAAPSAQHETAASVVVSAGAASALLETMRAAEQCNGQNVPFTENNGVKYTWASPCSGGCSAPVAKCGWDYCSDAQWAGLPEARMKNEQPCSAQVFDPKWNHCDASNRLVQRPNNGYDELVFCKGGSPSPSPKQAAEEQCDGQNVPYTPNNGVKYTWASPCSGGCSAPVAKCGWDYCSDAQWAGLPEAQMRNEQPCSAQIFDPKWNHCDSVNQLVQKPNGGYDELVFCKGDSPAPSPKLAPEEQCNGQNVPYTENNGVLYTWASPCSGGCSAPVAQCGWDYCSDAQWAGLPEAQMRNDNPCSAQIFDPKWNHCDRQNRLVQKPDGSYNELVFCKNAAPASTTTTTTTEPPTPSPTPSPLDDLEDEEREEEVEDEQNDIIECKQWCWKSKKHVNKPWHGQGGKCGWNACQQCPECRQD